MSLSIFIAGDVVNTAHGDGIFCDEDVLKVIQKADIAIANFEAPVISKAPAARKSGPLLAQHASTPSGLASQGFTAVTLANNHIMDYGEEGLEETLNALDRAGLQHVGAGMTREQAYTTLTISANGMRVAIINACESHHGVLDDMCSAHDTPGYAWLLSEDILRAISESKATHDATIVIAHAGLEHFSIPQLEWRLLYRKFCDFGANVVVGSHPHVPQGHETHNNSIIFYSLGNFYFDTNRYAASPDLTYSVALSIDGQQEISWRPVWTKKNTDWIVDLDNGAHDTMLGLNEMLGDQYEALRCEMALLKRRELLPLLQRSVGGPFCQTSVQAFLRHVARKLYRLGYREDRSVLFEHLLRNESYFYVLRHAASLDVTSKR